MNRVNKININNQFKVHTTALSYFVQSIASIIVGIIMIRDYQFFLARATTIIAMYFWFIIGMNFVQILLSFTRGMGSVRGSIRRFVGTGAVLTVFLTYNEAIYSLIPLVMVLWMLILGISSLISFLQNRREEDSFKISYLLSALLHFCFSIPFLTDFYKYLGASIHVIGIYLILLGGMMFLDGLSIGVPNKYKNLCKNRVRIMLPTLVTTFLPIALLNYVNRYFEEEAEESTLLMKVEKSQEKSNLEVFVHVSDAFKVGHVDLAFDNKILSYGSYDKESIRYKGIVGAGVMYEVTDRDVYTKFCSEVNGEILFGFGIALSDQELEKLRKHYEEMKENASIWKCKAQRAKERNEDTSEFQEYPCRLSQATDTTFYKFNKGKYKHYWVLGANCVKFIDDFLKSSGMKTIIAGIITPGTYYTFLNNQFQSGAGAVVTRTVYCKENK